MTTLFCLRTWGPKGFTSIGTGASRLLSTTTAPWPVSNIPPHILDSATLPQNISIRKLSLSAARYKEVFKRNKPHLNIGIYCQLFDLGATYTSISNLYCPETVPEFPLYQILRYSIFNSVHFELFK